MIEQVLRFHPSGRSLLLPPSRVIIRQYFPLWSQHVPDAPVMYVDLLEGIQQEYSNYNHEEAAGRAQGVLRAHLPPFPEQDRGRRYDQRREEDVIDRRHDGRVEQVQRLVQVIHLHHNAEDDAKQQDPRQPVGECILFPRDCLLQRQSQTLAAHDGERADGRAQEDVHNDVLLAVCRSEMKYD